MEVSKNPREPENGREKRRGLSLSGKIALGIMGIGLFVVGGTFVYLLSLHNEELEERAVRQAHLVCDIVSHALFGMMVRGEHTEDIEAKLKKITDQYGIDKLEIIRGPSVERQYGVEEDAHAKREEERKALAGERSFAITELDGHRSMFYAEPVRADVICRRCHQAEEGEILGAIVMESSMTEEEKAIRSEERGIALGMFGSLALAVLLLYGFLQKVIVRRIARLTSAARTVTEKGIPSEQGAVESGDEIGELAASFNQMIAALKQSQDGLEKEVAKRTEELEASKQQIEEYSRTLNSLVESMTDGVILLDPEHRVTLCNPSGASFLRCLTEDAKEERLTHLGRTPVKTLIDDVLRGGARAVSEVAFARDGSDRQFSVTISPVLGAGEQIIGAVLDLREITEERRAQEQVFQASKLASIGELAAGIAHELNNPLTSVIGYSELLLMRELDPKVKEDLKRIYREGERARQIVQDLLLFARGQRAETSYFDLNRTIEDTVRLVRAQLELSNIRTVLELDREIPSFYGDVGQIQQIFLNLLQNAHDAIQSSGIGSEIRIVTRQVGGDRIAVQVIDDGPGVSENVRQKIFDPFFTTKSPGKGTGLGLSIAYKIVQKHDGRISVRSKMNRGTQFLLEFPLRSPAFEMARSSEASDEIKEEKVPRSDRILVVDDEENVVYMISRALQADGYSVTVASDGRTALEMMGAQPFDAITLDLKMPDVDGWDVYEELAQRRPDLLEKVIFITGDTARPHTQDFLEKSGRPYLVKPFKLAELKGVVSACVRGDSR